MWSDCVRGVFLSVFDGDYFAVEFVQAGPAVDVAVVVGDLVHEPLLCVALDRSDHVGKRPRPYLAQDVVADFHVLRPGNRSVSAFLPMFDTRMHGVSALAKTHRFPRFQPRYPRRFAL